MRKYRKIRQAPFASKLGITVSTLYRLEHDDPRVDVDTVAQAAMELGLQYNWATHAIALPVDLPPEAFQADRQAGTNTHALPPGISSAAETAVIPQWDIDLRASAWAETPCASLDGDDPVQAGVLVNGRFRLRILGACMEPDYTDGMLVEFQVVRIDMEPLEPGADYAVCRSDGTATFKQLARVDAHTLFLRARNRKAYPEMLLVPRQEVCRMARVVFRLTPPPAVKFLKL